MHTLSYKRLLGCFALMLVFFGGIGYSQFDSLGGPYVTDQYTRLLMHFDSNLNNEGQSANGVGHGTLGYISNPGLGQCLRLVNDAPTDSSYVSVPDTSTLDLTGDWTIEGWINVFTFGGGSGDHRWVPRLVIKTGDAVFWRPNYFVEMWGDRRFFSCGYNVAGADRWPQVNSPDNIMQPGSWFHLTFIRDTVRHLLISMVHNSAREMISFTAAAYDTILDEPPILTDQPVNIGFAGGGNDSWLDGFVDEIRISSIIRPFRVPPIITGVTSLSNQPDSIISYPIDASIQTFLPSGTIQTTAIRYNDGSGWAETPLTPSGGLNYSGTIPQQPLGTVVQYYVYAVDNNGLRSTIPSSAEIDSTYFEFGIYSPNTQITYLPFEEASGMPRDSSAYHNTFTAPNNTPSYSTDRVVGLRSIYFDRDSTHIQSNSPFLNASEFTVDMWFNADTLIHAIRILNKEAGNADGTPADDWYHNNYEIGIRDVGGVFAASARYWKDASETQFELLLDSAALAPHTWYRLIFERTVLARAAFEIHDQSDVLLQKKISTVAYLPRVGPGLLRIAKASNDGQPWSYIPHFFGKIDDLKIFNYPAYGITAVSDRYQSSLPNEVQLFQNYPNPFNPTTTIRFALPRAQQTTLAVYSLLGQKVKTLRSEFLHAGVYDATWDGTDEFGRNTASGLYFVRLETQNLTLVRKVLLLK